MIQNLVLKFHTLKITMEAQSDTIESAKTEIGGFMDNLNLAFEKSGDVRISYLREAYKILDNGINSKIISRQDLGWIIQELAEIETDEEISTDELKFFNRIKLRATTALEETSNLS